MTVAYRDVIDVIEELHRDLAQWLGSPADEEVFARFAGAQDAQFSMVTTAGEVLGRAELLAGLRSARNAQPGLTITVTDIEELARTEDTIVVRFLEEHHIRAAHTCRRVTAVLVADEAAGFRWRTVHETELAA